MEVTHRFVAAIALAALTVCAPSAFAQQALDRIVSAKTIKIGIPVDAPPFGFRGADQQPTGLDVELAQLIASKIGVKAELVPVSSPQRVPALTEKKVDLVISTLGKTAEREKVIDFSNSYSCFYLAVFGPKSAQVGKAADLAGKSVAVTKGSVEDQELVKIVPAGTDIKHVSDSGAAVSAYTEGKAQYVAVSMSVMAAAKIQNTTLDADSKFVLKESLNYIGVPKGEDKLREKVNAIVEELRTSGELRKLGAKWFARSGMSAAAR